MLKVRSAIIIFFLLYSSISFASDKALPYLSGDILLMNQSELVQSSKGSDTKKFNTFLYSEANFSLNFNENFSLDTQWRSFPSLQISSNRDYNFNRYYSFYNSNRGINIDDHALVIEELKLDFKNEDLHFYLGKFDAKFGNAHEKSKRMGVFTWQFNEDYNLRENIGGGLSALLENSIVSFSTFFNDTTDLSRSAIKGRERAERKSGIAGSNGTLSSYVVEMKGKKLFNIENLFYNFGYRNLGIDDAPNRKREQGYVFGFEYLHDLANQTKIVPLIEIVKIDNFGGAKDRNAFYYTLSTIASYSSWSLGLTYNKREINADEEMFGKISDDMLQINIGYKISENMTIDFTRAKISESDSGDANVFGANLSYLYRF